MLQARDNSPTETTWEKPCSCVVMVDATPRCRCRHITSHNNIYCCVWPGKGGYTLSVTVVQFKNYKELKILVNLPNMILNVFHKLLDHVRNDCKFSQQNQQAARSPTRCTKGILIRDWVWMNTAKWAVSSVTLQQWCPLYSKKSHDKKNILYN